MASEGFRLFDGQDVTKKAKFILSEITSGKVIALIVPDMDGILVVEGSSPTLAGLKIGGLSGVLKSLENNVVGEAGFLDLKDTPVDYSEAASKFVKVKADMSGLEFVPETGGGGGPEAVAGRRISVYLNVNQSINPSIGTVVHFNTEVWDKLNEYNTGTYRFTPSVAGYYHIHASVLIDLNSVHQEARLQIVRTGILEAENTGQYNASSTTTEVIVSKTVYLTPMDYIEIYAWHNDSVARAVYGLAGYTWLTIDKIED